jgi:hypothetical protein
MVTALAFFFSLGLMSNLSFQLSILIPSRRLGLCGSALLFERTAAYSPGERQSGFDLPRSLFSLSKSFLRNVLRVLLIQLG